MPNSDWLEGTGLAGSLGVGIDPASATAVPGVFAAGDVTCFPAGTRTPFWSTAVAQGKAAAASALSIKVVGPLPPVGEPDLVEGSVSGGSALLTWFGGDGQRTVVSYGRRIPVPKLRSYARLRPT